MPPRPAQATAEGPSFPFRRPRPVGIVQTVRLRWSNLVLLAAFPACPSAVAPFVAHWHWTIDLLACFPVQAMAWLTFCALLLGCARRWRASMAIAAFAGVAALSVLPGWLRSPPIATENGHPVRVLALNLLRGNESQATAALAVVAEHNPDVLFCSEVTPGWLVQLQAGLPHLPHRCVRSDDGYFGVALFSRWPLQDAAVIRLYYEWAPAVRAVVATPGGPLGVLGVHTPRPGDGRSCQERDLALGAVAAALTPLPTSRVLLGDCNATPWNAAFVAMLAATGLRDARGGGWLPTWTSAHPWPLRIAIDHVLVSEGIGVQQCEVGRDFGSDHLPLFAVLRLPSR